MGNDLRTKIKSGMGGSNCDKGRSDKTETLKSESKKKRRKENKNAIKQD